MKKWVMWVLIGVLPIGSWFAGVFLGDNQYQKADYVMETPYDYVRKNLSYFSRARIPDLEIRAGDTIIPHYKMPEAWQFNRSEQFVAADSKNVLEDIASIPIITLQYGTSVAVDFQGVFECGSVELMQYITPTSTTQRVEQHVTEDGFAFGIYTKDRFESFCASTDKPIYYQIRAVHPVHGIANFWFGVQLEE